MDYDESTARKIAYQINSGYWKVADRCFFNKIDCLKFATRTCRLNVTYHYFDEVYNTLDWTKVPDQSLESMYADRAKKLRDKYKYISVLFSGGADSTNLVKAFLKNNIHIDEIISFYPVSASDKLLNSFSREDKSAYNTIFEYYEAAKPMLEYIAAHYPNIKITLIDYTKEILSLIDAANLHKIMQSGLIVNPLTTGFYLAFKKTAEHDNACVVTGVDKPRILFDTRDKKFKSYFLDFNTIFGHFPYDTFKGDLPKTEYFYYDPEMPYITIKQCRQILEHLFPILDEQHPLHSSIMRKTGAAYIVEVHHDYVKKLLYPDWNTDIYQAGKPIFHFYNEIGQWATSTDVTDSKTKDFYDGQIKEIVEGINPFFVLRDKNNKPTKLREFGTKFNLLH